MGAFCESDLKGQGMKQNVEKLAKAFGNFRELFWSKSLESRCAGDAYNSALWFAIGLGLDWEEANVVASVALDFEKMPLEMKRLHCAMPPKTASSKQDSNSPQSKTAAPKP